MGAFLDAPLWKRGLVKALGIKGDKEVPNEVNNDQVQITADATQDGFAVYEKKSIALTGTPNTSKSQTITVFDPSLYFEAEDTDPRANRLWEIRLLWLQLKITGMTVGTQGDKFQWTIRFLDKSNGSIVRALDLGQFNDGVQTEFRMALPSQVSEENGIMMAYNTLGWQGWIPAGMTMYVDARNEINFNGNEAMTVDGYFIRVPRGSMLPK